VTASRKALPQVSAPPEAPDVQTSYVGANVRYWQILLQKSVAVAGEQ
jgi:hypothetical protein